MKNVCSSYVEGRAGSICRDGFIQVHNCWDPQTCRCGHSYAGVVPPCLLDELPKQHSNENGTPLYYGRAALSDKEAPHAD